MKKNNWYRLDNSGMIYPMVITQNTQSLYRVGVKLAEEVDPNFLRVALNTALERYPYFRVELKHGFFRHYLDENVRTPLVEEDDGVLLKILNFRQNRYFLFRLTYFGKRIFLDFFHGLSDGNGAMEFLKTILYYYFKAKNDPIPRGDVKTLSTPEKKEEVEDAFRRYYAKTSFKKGLKKMASGFAFQVRGKQFAYEGFGLIQGLVDTDRLLAAARSYKCSITVYLAALALLSVAKARGESKQREDFVAFIPVNLRKKFPSGTMLNFTNFAKCSVPRHCGLRLEEFVSFVKNALKEQLREEELRLKISFTSLMDSSKLLRYTPLFIKSFFSRVGRDLSTKTKQTMIISNLGSVKIDAGDRIDHFLFNLNVSERTPVNLAIVSYNNKTAISFTRKIIDTDIEKEFFSTLSKEVGEVEVISNFREDNDVL
ncbi:MAG: hypothetical protein IJ735_03875 [Clostridia bacterium]|nr:hypothetical protein [Clostridia bacterium]